MTDEVHDIYILCQVFRDWKWVIDDYVQEFWFRSYSFSIVFVFQVEKRLGTWKLVREKGKKMKFQIRIERRNEIA